MASEKAQYQVRLNRGGKFFRFRSSYKNVKKIFTNADGILQFVASLVVIATECIADQLCYTS